MVSRVRQVARKLPVRTLVALPTGFDHIIPAQTRVRVDRAENIMGTVAIVAFGNTLPTQARNFAVERIKERLCLFFVTAAALLHHERPEPYLLGTHDGVRGMTIFTGGKTFIGDRIIGPVNALPELFLDSVMAGTAGSSYVLRMGRGVRILRRKFIVCSMAIGASCRYNETALYQSAAMHTVFVAADDIVDLGIDPGRGLLTYAMAIPAEPRNIQRIGWRQR